MLKFFRFLPVVLFVFGLITSLVPLPAKAAATSDTDFTWLSNELIRGAGGDPDNEGDFILLNDADTFYKEGNKSCQAGDSSKWITDTNSSSNRDEAILNDCGALDSKDNITLLLAGANANKDTRIINVTLNVTFDEPSSDFTSLALVLHASETSQDIEGFDVEPTDAYASGVAEPGAGACPAAGCKSKTWFYSFSSSDADIIPLLEYEACINNVDACATGYKLAGQELNITINTNAASFEDLVSDMNSGEDEDGPECEAGLLTWVICPTIHLIQDVTQFVLQSIITPFLKVSPLQATGEIYETWKGIRNLANVLLVPIFFVLIFAQTLSLNLDVYAIKKMLPKLIAASILIQFSYFIAALMVDFTNVIGNGLGSLIVAAGGSVGELNFTFSTGDSVLAGLGVAGLVVAGVGAVATGAILVLLVPLLLAMLGVLLTLIFRQLIIVVLAVLSPIAFVAWILPNTNKIFQLWWDNFLRALMMYPLIVLLFAAAALFAPLASNMTFATDANIEGLGENIKTIAAIAILIVPFGLIPFTFKFAGGALAGISGGVDKLRGRVAYGKDGKGGVMKGIGERNAMRKKQAAAGILPAWQKGRWNPIGRAATVSSRFGTGFAGTGIGRKARSQAAIAFNEARTAAGKDLEAKGFNDGSVLSHFSEVGHSKVEFGRRVRALRNSADPKEVELAHRLEAMRDLVGKREYTGAALYRAAEQGKAGDNKVGGEVVGNAFEGASRTLSGNRTVQMQAVSDAAFKSRERNLSQAGWKVDERGRAFNDAETIESAIATAKPSDLAAHSNLKELEAPIRSVLSGSQGAEAASHLNSSLSYALTALSDASPANKSFIQGLGIAPATIPPGAPGTFIPVPGAGGPGYPPPGAPPPPDLYPPPAPGNPTPPRPDVTPPPPDRTPPPGTSGVI